MCEGYMRINVWNGPCSSGIYIGTKLMHLSMTLYNSFVGIVETLMCSLELEESVGL